MPFFAHQTPPVPEGKSPDRGWDLTPTWKEIYNFVGDVLDDQLGEAVLVFSQKAEPDLADVLEMLFQDISPEEARQAVEEALRR
jgi:hypothetical protein